MTPLVAIAIVFSTVCVATNASESKAAEPLARIEYGPAVEELQRLVQDEIQRGLIPGVSIALIDRQHVVLAKGFGLADKERGTRATAETVYRVGSISKLFTALAVMQLAEQGQVDLDAPVTEYLPDFHIVHPFEKANPITLRQLMCHRSGMVREPPVGGYFDGSEPTIAQSIASLNSCVLVNPPNTKTRYSNIGVTIVGQVVSAVSATSFEQYQGDHLLRPVGMDQSAWSATALRERLAKGYMRIADGRGGFNHRQAPPFELGTVPAGNLYSNVRDMARFATMLLTSGVTTTGRVVSKETLAQMATPQLTDQETGFGLGFYIGQFEGHSSMQHSGAVYGFSTSIVVLPEPAIAVVVLANEDIAPGPVRKISDAALGLMLHAKLGQKIAQRPVTQSMGAEELSDFVGQFESPVHWAEVELTGSQLTANIASQPVTLRPVGAAQFEADGRWVHRAAFEFQRDDQGNVTGFTAFGQHFDKKKAEPCQAPWAWHDYLGSYGPDFIPLVISLRHGHLYAMTENMVDYRLTPVNQTVFKMPEGLYADECLAIRLDANGHAHGVCLANMYLPRIR